MRLFKSLRFYFGDILDHTSVFVLFLPVLTDSFSFENLFDTLSPVVCTTKRLKTLMKMSILWMASAIHCSCIHANRYPVRLQITLTATMTPCRLVFYQVASVRALHRCRRHGFKSRSSLNFFQPLCPVGTKWIFRYILNSFFSCFQRQVRYFVENKNDYVRRTQVPSFFLVE